MATPNVYVPPTPQQQPLGQIGLTLAQEINNAKQAGDLKELQILDRRLQVAEATARRNDVVWQQDMQNKMFDITKQTFERKLQSDVNWATQILPKIAEYTKKRGVDLDIEGMDAEHLTSDDARYLTDVMLRQLDAEQRERVAAISAARRGQVPEPPGLTPLGWYDKVGPEAWNTVQWISPGASIDQIADRVWQTPTTTEEIGSFQALVRSRLGGNVPTIELMPWQKTLPVPVPTPDIAYRKDGELIALDQQKLADWKAEQRDQFQQAKLRVMEQLYPKGVTPGAVLDITRWRLLANESAYIANLEKAFDNRYGVADRLPRGTRDAKGQLYVSERMGAIVEPYGQTQTQQRISMASPSKQFSTRAEAEAAFVAAFGPACLERPEVQRALDAAYPK